MRAEPAREFVDTNVLVYAFDASAGRKKAVAEELLARLWETGTGCLSVQVLQEFFVTITGKVPQRLPIEEAADRIREFATWRVFAPTADDVLGAIALHQRAQLSFWDASVVRAAAEMGSSVLWTEDLKDGHELQGVRFRNPFAEPASADRSERAARKKTR
jgi:predicted nucleic acid-binding protein